MISSPTHILLLRLSAMGDVAISVPVLRAFARQHPGVQITVVSRAFFQPFFENIPNVSFYPVEVKTKHKGLLGLYRLSRELKTLNIGAIADLHDVLRSKILRSFLSSPKVKTAIIDKGRAEKKALTRTQNKIFKQLKTSAERYADVFRNLGFAIDLSAPVFPQKNPLSKKALNIIPQDHLKWIGVAPFAQHSSKMYPLHLIKEVITSLAKTNNYKLLLFGGGAQEVAALDALADKIQHTISVAGKLELQDELNLIAHLDVMLSMDSANAHLSAMQGIKTITLWGATHPYAGFAPFNQPETNQILPDLKKYPLLPCSVYGNKVIKGYEKVIESISPAQVVDKIIRIC